MLPIMPKIATVGPRISLKTNRYIPDLSSSTIISNKYFKVDVGKLRTSSANLLRLERFLTLFQ